MPHQDACSCAPTWLQVRRAADALGLLADQTFGTRHAVRKRDRDPLDPDDYVDLTRDFLQDLLGWVEPSETRAMDDLLRELRRTAPSTSDAARDGVAATLLRGIQRLGTSLASVLSSRIEGSGQRFLPLVKRGANARYHPKGKATLTAEDRAVLRRLAANQGAALRKHYDRRAAALLPMVLRALRAGSVSADLAAQMRETFQRHGESYYRMVAALTTGRWRSYGVLTVLAAAGIPTVRIHCKKTAESCDWCRVVDGNPVPVLGVLRRFLNTIGRDTPDALRERHPFVGTGKDDGGRYLYYRNADGKRVLLARVKRSAVGEAGKVGQYDMLVSHEELLLRGIDVPPFHPQCQCELRADAKSVDEPVTVQADRRPERPAIESLGTPRSPVDIPVRPMPERVPAQRLTEGPPVPVPPRTTVETVPIEELGKG